MVVVVVVVVVLLLFFVVFFLFGGGAGFCEYEQRVWIQQLLSVVVFPVCVFVFVCRID